MLEHRGTVNEVMASGRESAVLVADPGGKLKLARWRLQSDGYRVYYIQDQTTIMPLLESGEIQAVLVNVGGHQDFDLLKTISQTKGHFGIVAVTGPELAKTVSSLGVQKTLGRPIEYPQLSAAMKAVIGKRYEQNGNNGPVSRFKGRIPMPVSTRFRRVLDYVKTGVLMLDASGRATFANESMRSLLQMDSAFPKKNYREILAMQSMSSLLDILEYTFKSGQASGNVEIAVPGAGGESAPGEAQVHPMLNRSGEFIGAFLTVEDISNPRKLEKVMVQSEKLAMVGQLAAGAAHEIRNPLTSVRGFIQLLQNELEGTPKVDYINIIIAEIDRVNTIVNEFLKLAKPAIPNRKACDIRTLLEDIRMLVESEAFLKNVSIIEDVPAVLPLVLIDMEQAKQVLINVIRNSFEAMDEGGRLTIRAYSLPKENEVCLEISDTGCGMDEETLKKVSVPFFTTKDNGTGLGMAVSQQIMESHGGRMEIRSKPGQGTATFLHFPCE